LIVTQYVFVKSRNPTPKTCTGSSEVLDQQVDYAAHKQQWQTQVDKHPKHYPQSQVGFFQTMPHHGLVLFALGVGFEHAEILGA
jgi:hypothetical protein